MRLLMTLHMRKGMSCNRSFQKGDTESIELSDRTVNEVKQVLSEGQNPNC